MNSVDAYELDLYELDSPDLRAMAEVQRVLNAEAEIVETEEVHEASSRDVKHGVLLMAGGAALAGAGWEFLGRATDVEVMMGTLAGVYFGASTFAGGILLAGRGLVRRIRHR